MFLADSADYYYIGKTLADYTDCADFYPIKKICNIG